MATQQGGTLIPKSSDEEIKPQFLYMKRPIKFSRLIFMWPSINNLNSIRYHIAVWFIIFNSLLMILSFSVQIIREHKNIDYLTELIDFDTVFISATFRFCYIYFRARQYLKLVHIIHTKFIHHPFIPTKNHLTLDDYYKFANKLIFGYSVFTMFWILQLCSVPALGYAWAVYSRTNDSEIIPYPMLKKVYVPFDAQLQPQNGLLYAFQAVFLILFGWIYVTVDSFWYMVISLTVGQFALIKDSLNTMTEILKGDTMEVSLMGKGEILEIEAALKRCIKHHQFLRRFVRVIDKVSNPNILVDSLHAIISIAFILLDVTISLNAGDWNKLMYSMEYFITSIVHMFFFDWLGNELAEKEEELSGAVYEIPWYRLPTLKTNILLMSMQSRRPYRLTGGRMYKLTLDFFTSMVRAVFSYFTFLLQLRNK